MTEPNPLLEYVPTFVPPTTTLTDRLAAVLFGDVEDAARNSLSTLRKSLIQRAGGEDIARAWVNKFLVTVMSSPVSEFAERRIIELQEN